MVVIGITGITGSQGGAVADIFLKNNHKIVGITRNINSDRAMSLKKSGVHLVEGDFDNSESLNGVFNGCHVVFAMTNFWDHMDSKREYTQAINIINASKHSNVKHIVWSTLEDTRNYTDDIKYIGDYKVPHFDEKGMVSRYLDELGGDIHVSHLYTSFFYENFTNMMKLKKGEDGVRNVCMPMSDSVLPMVSVLDIAKMTYKIVEDQIYGNVGVASEHLKVSEVASILQTVIGEPVEYTCVPASVYRTFGFPGCEDLGNMFEFKDVHNTDFCKKRNMEDVRKLIEPINFKTWCETNKDKL